MILDPHELGGLGAISIMTFWCWEFRLTQVPVWTFESYFFIVCYCALCFMVSTMLFPSDVREFGSYETYLLERRAWFFGLIALLTARVRAHHHHVQDMGSLAVLSVFKWPLWVVDA